MKRYIIAYSVDSYRDIIASFPSIISRVPDENALRIGNIIYFVNWVLHFWFLSSGMLSGLPIACCPDINVLSFVVNFIRIDGGTLDVMR